MGLKPRPIRFAPTDGWILAAVAHASTQRPASWRQVIASADYINRAVPTFAELAGASGRLEVAGLIEVSATGVRVASQVASAVKSSEGPLRLRYATVLALPTPCSERPSRQRRRISRAEYNEAVRIHDMWG